MKRPVEPMIHDRAIFERLFDYSPDAILVSDEEGRIVAASVQAERMFGYPRDQLIGQPVDVLVSAHSRPSDSLKRIDHSSQLLPTIAGSDHYGRRNDGVEFPVEIMLNPVETPEGTVVLRVVRDLTERTRTDEALQRSEKQFRALFEYSPDAIVVTDPQGKIAEINAQVEKFFGYNRGELLGQSVEMLIPERFRSIHPKYRSDYGAQAKTRPMGIGLNLHGRRKDGSEFPVDIMLSPVETQEGKITLSVIRDLSEKMRAQEELERKKREKRYLEEELNTEHRFEDIIGETTVLRKILKQVETVSATDVTVLILGETGTGKDLVARAIHQLSSRRERTLVKLNCAAIPTGLLESELFGHERGAFTGAISQKIGRLELAHQGTLFLDEVGDLPPELQPKVLRAIQEKEFERLGGTRTIPVDVRLVAATNRNLERMVADREFRSDLYYRLRVFPITMPALRERRDDIPLLVRYFVTKHARRMDKQIDLIPSDVMKALMDWHWPGNIRELENFIERAVILSRGPTLRVPVAEIEVALETPSTGDSTLESTEREHILRVLRESNGLIGGPKGAATRLGLKRTTLNSKLKKLRIEREDYI